MEEGGHRRVLEQHTTEVLHLRTTRDWVHLVSDRMLHEGVGRKNEVGREHGAKGCQPDRGEVNSAGESIPAEDPQTQESGLEEE